MNFVFSAAPEPPVRRARGRDHLQEADHFPDPETALPTHHAEVLSGVSARIRALRLAQGITQKQLGSAIGVSFQQIQKYETDARRLALPRLLALSEALGVSCSFLVDGGFGGAETLAEENGLRAFRERMGLTMRDVAQAAGTSHQNISLLERGRLNIKVDWLIRLGRALNCHPWAVIDPTGVAASEDELAILRFFRRAPELVRRRMLRASSDSEPAAGVDG